MLNFLVQLAWSIIFVGLLDSARTGSKIDGGTESLC